MEKLVIVEDNDEIRSQLRWGLSGEYEVLVAGNRLEALSLFKKHLPKVVTLDLGLPPDENGCEEGFRCLDDLLRQAPATKVIMITGNEESGNALRAVQSGAYDYYRKPLNLSELKVILARAFHLAAIEKENMRLQLSLDQHHHTPGGIIGQSPQMMEVFSSVRKVASSDVAVLITGESGTGKELVARAIRELSPRKSGAFIAIAGRSLKTCLSRNCSATKRALSAVLTLVFKGRWNMPIKAPFSSMKLVNYLSISRLNYSDSSRKKLSNGSGGERIFP